MLLFKDYICFCVHLLLLKTINFYTQEIADPDIHVPNVDCFVCGEVIRMDELTQHQDPIHLQQMVCQQQRYVTYTEHSSTVCHK